MLIINAVYTAWWKELDQRIFLLLFSIALAINLHFFKLKFISYIYWLNFSVTEYLVESLGIEWKQLGRKLPGMFDVVQDINCNPQLDLKEKIYKVKFIYAYKIDLFNHDSFIS